MKSILLLLLTVSLTVSSQTFQVENNSLLLPSEISFKPGTAVLTPESESALKHVLAYLNQKDYISLIRVEGHVFTSQNDSVNLVLSQNRALIVCKWLIMNGIDCKRLIAVGFGNYKPITDTNTPEGKTTNTRICFVNAEIRGRSIGGLPVDGSGIIAGDVCK